MKALLLLSVFFFFFKADLLLLTRVIPLPWVNSSVIGQLFCADQQGPHIVMAFYTSRGEDDGLFGSKVVSVDLQRDKMELFEQPMANCRFNLDGAVNEMRLFLCATSEYRVTHEFEAFILLIF